MQVHIRSSKKATSLPLWGKLRLDGGEDRGHSNIEGEEGITHPCLTPRRDSREGVWLPSSSNYHNFPTLSVYNML